MIPDVGFDTLPSSHPVEPCRHASVQETAPPATVAAAVEALQTWLRCYAINAKYPTDPELDQMSLPLLQFYYRFYEFLYGCFTTRRLRPLSPFSNTCRGLFSFRSEKEGITTLVLGMLVDNPRPVPLFRERVLSPSEQPVPVDIVHPDVVGASASTDRDIPNNHNNPEESADDDDGDDYSAYSEPNVSPRPRGKGLMAAASGGKRLLVAPPTPDSASEEEEVDGDPPTDNAVVSYPLKSSEGDEYGNRAIRNSLLVVDAGSVYQNKSLQESS
jgi:hypothetical protein